MVKFYDTSVFTKYMIFIARKITIQKICDLIVGIFGTKNNSLEDDISFLLLFSHFHRNAAASPAANPSAHLKLDLRINTYLT